MPRVLILGGGFGGLTVASQLADRMLPGLGLTLVDQRPTYMMGLAKLWVLDGRRTLEEHRHAYDSLEGRGVRFVRGVVRRIDVDHKVVHVGEAKIPYDYLVVALGAELAPATLAGFEPGMDLYAEAGVEHLRRQLGTFRSGRIVVMVSSLPFKCPPAPYEAAFLVESFLRRRGFRAETELRLTTPEPHPLPVAPPEYGQRLTELLKEKGIRYDPGHHPTFIDAPKRLIHYQNGAKINYDLLMGVPPHRAPAVVREAGLTDDSGWVPVDPKTLATRYEDVWAIGDVAGVQLANGKLLPRAGTLAAGQGHVVAEQIAARIQGRTSTARFDGKGVCYIETGDGLAVAGRGSFYHEPQPVFDLAPPTPEALREKELFEKHYLKQWFG